MLECFPLLLWLKIEVLYYLFHNITLILGDASYKVNQRFILLCVCLLCFNKYYFYKSFGHYFYFLIYWHFKMCNDACATSLPQSCSAPSGLSCKSHHECVPSVDPSEFASRIIWTLIPNRRMWFYRRNQIFSFFSRSN